MIDGFMSVIITLLYRWCFGFMAMWWLLATQAKKQQSCDERNRISDCIDCIKTFSCILLQQQGNRYHGHCFLCDYSLWFAHICILQSVVFFVPGKGRQLRLASPLSCRVPWGRGILVRPCEERVSTAHGQQRPCSRYRISTANHPELVENSKFARLLILYFLLK